jgi:hypothetical protein
MGMAKPVKMTRARIIMAAGTMACERVREELAMVLNIIDMQTTVTKLMRRKKK